MKNPLTPAGIEPATFRFVAQHLNAKDNNTSSVWTPHILQPLFSFPSLAIFISLHLPSVYHWNLFPHPFLLPSIFFFTNSSNFLLLISRYLCVLPNFYFPNSAFSLFLSIFSNSVPSFPPTIVLLRFTPLIQTLFTNPEGLACFLRPFWLSIRLPVPSQHRTKAINPIHAGAWLWKDETSTSTSFTSPSFLRNSRTADDVYHYKNHSSPIPPLRCFFKNCHQSSTPWHKLSRQTLLYPPTKLFPVLSSYPLWIPSVVCSLPAPNHL